jgi:hypothetical protein
VRERRESGKEMKKEEQINNEISHMRNQTNRFQRPFRKISKQPIQVLI